MCDGYKLDHRRQYPNNTIKIYSNWTPRGSRMPGVDKVVVFGIQYFIKKYLIEEFKTNFFDKPKQQILDSYKRKIKNYLGDPDFDTQHISDLHDLGYLPIYIKALPEGTLCPIGVPMLTIVNTKPEFFWVTNFLETIMSCQLWKPMVSASIALEYWKEFKRHSDKTGSPEEFICWQGHDFSFRGMAGFESCILSAMGHLTIFTGTDTFPAIEELETYYNVIHEEHYIGGSISATEHSVQSLNAEYNEVEIEEEYYVEIKTDSSGNIISEREIKSHPNDL